MSPRRARAAGCCGALLLCLVSSTAHADSALLFGGTIGASVEQQSTRPWAARFQLGASVDWLHADGLTLSCRAGVSHTLDARIALLGGWSGPGLVSGRGLPLGFALGVVAARSEHGYAALGGRAAIILSLWYDRAAVEVDTTIRTPIGRHAPSGLELAAGLSLRLVPWPAIVL